MGSESGVLVRLVDLFSLMFVLPTELLLSAGGLG